MASENNSWTSMSGRRLSRRAILRAGAFGAGFAGLAAAGCGGGGRKGGVNAPAGAPAQAPVTKSSPGTAPGAGNFKTGGTIQIQFSGPIGLDPYENSSFRAQNISGMSYSQLFRFNSGTDPSITLSREPVPDLVASYEIAPDGLTYTMKLRQEVNFQPPLSRPLTSADVTASYQRFTTDPKNVNGAVFKTIVDSLTAPDDQTLVFKLKAPYSPFLNTLANPQYFWIMSRDAVDGKVDPSKQIVGTGPWIFVNESPTAYTFKKNPDYFIKGIPYADGAIFNIIPDAATQEAQFQAGKIDFFYPPATDVDSLKKAVPKSNVASYVWDNLHFIFFSNVSSPDSPFHDVRMRRAVSLAIDRDGFIDLILNGQAVWSGFVNPGLGKWALDPKSKEMGDAGQWYKHDPAQAKKLLAEAGHANTEFKFIYPNNAYSDVFNSGADAIRGMLSDAGFKLTVVTVDYQKDYINNGQGIFFKGAPPNSIVNGLSTPFTDPDDFFFNMLSSESTRNHESVKDPQIDALIKQERAALDENARQKLVYQMQRIVADQMYYPTVEGPKRFLLSQPWVQNVFVADDFAFGTEQVAYLSLNK